MDMGDLKTTFCLSIFNIIISMGLDSGSFQSATSEVSKAVAVTVMLAYNYSWVSIGITELTLHISYPPVVLTCIRWDHHLVLAMSTLLSNKM